MIINYLIINHNNSVYYKIFFLKRTLFIYKLIFLKDYLRMNQVKANAKQSAISYLLIRKKDNPRRKIKTRPFTKQAK